MSGKGLLACEQSVADIAVSFNQAAGGAKMMGKLGGPGDRLTAITPFQTYRDLRVDLCQS